MFRELLARLQKPMTIQERASLLDEIVLVLLKDRAELEALNEQQVVVARDMGKEYY